MLNLLILILIFLENALILPFPHNIIALPYITYLAYRKGRIGVFQVVLVSILISNSGKTFIETSIVFIFIFVISYFLSKVLEYEVINIVYYSLIQLFIYGLYLFMKLSNVSSSQLLIMLGGYLLVNYIMIKKLRKEI